MNTIHHAGIRTPGLESCDSSASQSVRHLVSKIEVESHDTSSFPCDSFKMRLYKEGNWSSCIIEV